VSADNNIASTKEETLEDKIGDYICNLLWDRKFTDKEIAERVGNNFGEEFKETKRVRSTRKWMNKHGEEWFKGITENPVKEIPAQNISLNLDLKAPVEIIAKDCCPFERQDFEPIVEFISLHNSGVKSFFTDRLNNESPIASFDNKQMAWVAGRYVGESVFQSQGKTYRVAIQPRFGNHFLFSLLEEVFNIRISESLYKQSEINSALFIKRIIAFIWLQKLAKANQYGFPRRSISLQQTGTVLKGKLFLSKSIISLKTRGELVSVRLEKEYDHTILSILFQAYLILKREYFLGSFNIPENVADILSHLESEHDDLGRPLTDHDFKAIRYRDIYRKFKEIVDFSWAILKSKANPLQGNTIGKGHSFFIDMAELWEMYIRSILKKHFTTKGWQIQPEEILSYKGKYFERKLIPDIVMTCQNEVVILDAKYKRMSFAYNDFDREDFFQIHTYAGAVGKNQKLNSIGLVYPLIHEISDDIASKLFQKGLYFSSENGSRFLCDGIYFDKENNSRDSLKKFENEFCIRIEKAIRE